jgi:hypothetical protein
MTIALDDETCANVFRQLLIRRAGSGGRSNSIWYKAVFKAGVYEGGETHWAFRRRRRATGGVIGRQGRHCMKSGAPLTSHIAPFGVCCAIRFIISLLQRLLQMMLDRRYVGNAANA